MGYACPVCETPQADAGHLGDHLAITAIARGGDHEAWLDEQVPDWADLDKATLAEQVAQLAEATEYPQVFEDTTGETASTGRDFDPTTVEQLAGDATDTDVEAVLEEARKLTERRHEESETE